MKNFIEKIKNFLKNLFKSYKGEVEKREIKKKSIIIEKEPTTEKRKRILEYKPSIYFGNNHWQLFTSFINLFFISTPSPSPLFSHFICSNLIDNNLDI